jgi:hypothetical protein
MKIVDRGQPQNNPAPLSAPDNPVESASGSSTSHLHNTVISPYPFSFLDCKLLLQTFFCHSLEGKGVQNLLRFKLSLPISRDVIARTKFIAST